MRKIKLFLLFAILCTLFFSCRKNDINEYNQIENKSLEQRVPTSVKKGVGLTESTFGAVQLDSLGVSWYYSWGPTTTEIP